MRPALAICCGSLHLIIKCGTQERPLLRNGPYRICICLRSVTEGDRDIRCDDGTLRLRFGVVNARERDTFRGLKTSVLKNFMTSIVRSTLVSSRAQLCSSILRPRIWTVCQQLQSQPMHCRRGPAHSNLSSTSQQLGTAGRNSSRFHLRQVFSSQRASSVPSFTSRSGSTQWCPHRRHIGTHGTT